jgi:hypothetical protein
MSKKDLLLVDKTQTINAINDELYCVINENKDLIEKIKLLDDINKENQNKINKGNNKIDSLNIDIQKYLNIIKNQEETIKKIESESKHRVNKEKIKETQMEEYLRNLETEMKDIELN